NGQSASVAGTFTYTSAAGSVLHAGNGQFETVTFTPSDTAAYTTTTTTVTVNVTPEALTISADSKGMVYGSTLPALTASYGGLVNGDTPSAVTGLVLATVPATSHADSYAITASGATDPDYTISFASGTLTITPAPLTISADGKSMVYGGSRPALTASYS